MAVKRLKRGDLVAMKVPGYGVTYKCVVTSARYGITGRMTHMVGGEQQELYYEKQDLANMRRLKSSQVPKKLAELSRKLRKNQ